MSTPFLTVDVGAIEQNARAIAGLCASHGLEVTGVTKGTCGHPEVARAMLRGGVHSLGESRLANVERLRAGGIDAEVVLLRVAAPSEVDRVVAAVAVSLESELRVIRALSRAAERAGRVHDVVAMIEFGDLREGMLPGEVEEFVREAAALRGVRLVGVGTNLTCFGGVTPDERRMGALVHLAEQAEETLGGPLRWISGGNSSSLELIAAGGMPSRVNHVRIGEAILLGRETLHRNPWPGTRQDAFRLFAEVVEEKTKPSAPAGERVEDAFGQLRQFERRGPIDHVLLNLGREDVDPDGLTPLDPGVLVLGATSDYLVLDVTDSSRSPKAGDVLGFDVSYGALLAAMDSAYVDKRVVGGPADRGVRRPGAAGTEAS